MHCINTVSFNNLKKSTYLVSPYCYYFRKTVNRIARVVLDSVPSQIHFACFPSKCPSLPLPWYDHHSFRLGHRKSKPLEELPVVWTQEVLNMVGIHPVHSKSALRIHRILQQPKRESYRSCPLTHLATSHHLYCVRIYLEP